MTPMFVRRSPRLITVAFALVSLLFMQVAMAGYACPMEMKGVEVAAMTEAGMPCAGDMSTTDTDQPGLCHAHCQSSQQNADTTPTLTPIVAVATGITYSVEPALSALLLAPPTRGPSLLRSTAPPLSIRNCCFRI